MLRRRGLQRLVGMLGVLLPLCTGCLRATPEISQQAPETSPRPEASEVLAPVAPAQSGPQLAGCSLFPADNIWNVLVDTLPVDPNSDLYIGAIGADVGLHPDFGSGLYEGGPIGIPYVVVPGDQPKVSASFEYEEESDSGGYPIPSNPPIEGGPESDGDRHILMLDRDNCILYELFYAFQDEDGGWTAGSGAIFDLKSHDLRPDGWTSADAAGLPILPGLVHYDEIAAGEILHALRFTVPETRRGYVWPARHFASSRADAQYPPMGQRFRLKADFDMSGFAPEVQVILRALQKYGMMLADNGSPWFISGVPDERWDNDMLRQLRQVQGADFEAVDVSSLQLDPDSGQARVGQSLRWRGERPPTVSACRTRTSRSATISPATTPPGAEAGAWSLTATPCRGTSVSATIEGSAHASPASNCSG